MGRLSNGEKLAGVSAILLLVLTFCNWYGIEAANNSSVLSYLNLFLPDKSAWEALDYIPFVLASASAATFVAVELRLMESRYEPPVRANLVVTILGAASALLVLLRIVDPPYLGTFLEHEELIAVIRLPVYLALLAAVGVAAGGGWASWEEGR